MFNIQMATWPGKRIVRSVKRARHLQRHQEDCSMNKHNRIVLGTGVIIIGFIWIGYGIFGVALGMTVMSLEAAYITATATVIAMVVGTWVKTPAVTYTEQIPMVPQKTPWEEEEYMRLKTHAARAMWLIYRITGNIHPDLFYLWVTDHLEWQGGSEESQKKAFEANVFPMKTGGDVDNYLFDSSNENWWTHDEIGNGQIKCFILHFWERQSDGSKKWVRVLITDKIAEIYLQPGESDGRSETMVPTDKPKLVDVALLKDALEGFNVQ